MWSLAFRCIRFHRSWRLLISIRSTWRVFHIPAPDQKSVKLMFLLRWLKSFSVAREFKRPPVHRLPGSGFKVAYQDGDAVTNVHDLDWNLTKAFTEFCEQYGRANLSSGLGRVNYIVSDAGNLFVKNYGCQVNPSVTFLGVNSGLNHLIRLMMYDTYHSITNVSNPEGPQKTYTVVGYICETDTIGLTVRLTR